MGIDLLAVNAWSGRPHVVAYEVKISRSDLRRELLEPSKREVALRESDRYYFATPAGLLTPDEVAYQQDDFEVEDFDRVPCARTGYRHHRKRRQGCIERVPVPIVLDSHDSYAWRGWETVDCRTCGGRGYAQLSLVEREAPVVWLPPEVGLIEVHSNGRTREVKRAPSRKIEGLFVSQQARQLVRWVSRRPDPRHVGDVALRRVA